MRKKHLNSRRQKQLFLQTSFISEMIQAEKKPSAYFYFQLNFSRKKHFSRLNEIALTTVKWIKKINKAELHLENLHNFFSLFTQISITILSIHICPSNQPLNKHFFSITSFRFSFFPLFVYLFVYCFHFKWFKSFSQAKNEKKDKPSDHIKNNKNYEKIKLTIIVPIEWSHIWKLRKEKSYEIFV